MDRNSPLIGKRCVVVRRCSDEKQVKDSMAQQRKATTSFIEKYKMVVVDEVEAPAVSASLTKHKAVIYGLRDKKRRGELDFDVMLFADWSRFTRTGRRDGYRILADLADEEILLVTVKDGLLAGKDGESRTDQNLRDSEAYAETLAYNVSRGMEDALEEAEIPHCTLAPYGTDRCYISADGTPEFILRAIGGGQKAMLNPITREVIKILNHSPDQPAVVKQPDQKIVLVKGPPEEVQVVNEVFALRYLDGWGSGRICRLLNERRVPSPRGKGWTRCTVERMYRNWMYLGVGYANQTTSGVYVKRAAGAPVELPERRTPGKRKDGLGHREHIVPIPRPRQEWLPVKYPALADLLAESIRQVAREKMESEAQTPRTPLAKRNYGQSSYFLRGILRTHPYDLPMNGLPSVGWKNKKYRYYSLHRAINCPGVDQKLSARVRADHVEHEVLAALASTLADPEIVSAGVRDYIDDQLRLIAADTNPLPRLLEQKASLEDEYRAIHTLYGRHGQELLKARSEELEKRLDEVVSKIASAQQASPIAASDTDAIIKSVSAQCAEMTSLLGQRSSGALRRVIEMFVPEATFDLEKKVVEIKIALPTWGISKEQRLAAEVRPSPSSADARRHGTHCGDHASLSEYRCLVGRIGRHPCMKCSRTWAATDRIVAVAA